MKETDLKYKVQQKLVEFDNLGSIEPSKAWNHSLMARIEHSKQKTGAGFTTAGFLIPVILIVLINLGFILNAVIRNSAGTNSHHTELQAISNQLLINQTSSNN